MHVFGAGGGGGTLKQQQEPRAARGRVADGDPPRRFMARLQRGGSSHPPTCPDVHAGPPLARSRVRFSLDSHVVSRRRQGA